MALFSERYGYVNPSDVFIRECMPEDICNVVATVFDILYKEIDSSNYSFSADSLELYVWCNFFNKRRNDAIDINGYVEHNIVDFILDEENLWYKKLDLLEFCISYMKSRSKNEDDDKLVNHFINAIKNQFKRLCYAYSIVGDEISEITTDEEINTINTAIVESNESVKTHISEALVLYSKRPDPDYRNSIKESISAVESLCREITNESTLGEALKKLESKGVMIQPQLKEAFVKLYAYTNQPDTGIRHSIMDAKGNYFPSEDEAYYMLVSCSAFINYIRRKT